MTPPAQEWLPPTHNCPVAAARLVAAGDLERCIFDAIAEAIQTEQDQWKQPDDGDINAYGFKRISITRAEVSSIAGVLRANRSAHCVLEIQVFKYWYDPAWGSSGVPDTDLITDEFAISIPLRVRWSTMEDRLVAGKLISGKIPGPKLILLAHASHIFTTDQPEAAHRAILEFLESQQYPNL